VSTKETVQILRKGIIQLMKQYNSDKILEREVKQAMLGLDTSAQLSPS
jgi:hypothetical protein